MEDIKLAMSGSKEGIEKIISGYFFGSAITLVQTWKHEYRLRNKNGKILNYRIDIKQKRFYFIQEVTNQ